MKKIDIQTREQPMLARLRELNWQTSGKKAHLFEKKILLSIFSIWRKIINSVGRSSVTRNIYRKIFDRRAAKVDVGRSFGLISPRLSIIIGRLWR